MLHPVYRCYLEAQGCSGSGKLIMGAKKKSVSKTSYYLISMEEVVDDRGSGSVLGIYYLSIIYLLSNITIDLFLYFVVLIINY
jgi:hypothetical protein